MIANPYSYTHRDRGNWGRRLADWQEENTAHKDALRVYMQGFRRGRLRGEGFVFRGAFGIAPLCAFTLLSRKGSKNLLLDLSRRLLTHVELPGI